MIRAIRALLAALAADHKRKMSGAPLDDEWVGFDR